MIYCRECQYFSEIRSETSHGVEYNCTHPMGKGFIGISENPYSNFFLLSTSTHMISQLNRYGHNYNQERLSRGLTIEPPQWCPLKNRTPRRQEPGKEPTRSLIIDDE